jgi:hypothetical protein
MYLKENDLELKQILLTREILEVGGVVKKKHTTNNRRNMPNLRAFDWYDS